MKGNSVFRYSISVSSEEALVHTTDGKDFRREKEKEVKGDIFSLIAEGKAPKELRLKAARGEFPLNPDELLNWLFVLKDDADPDVRATVIETGRQFPEEDLKRIIKTKVLDPRVLDFITRISLGRDETLEMILLDSDTRDETVEYLAESIGEKLLRLIATDHERLARRPSIIERVLKNKEANEDIRKMMLVEKAEKETEEEFKKKSLLFRISRLTASQKVILALKGTREARKILIRDPNKGVALSVLQSPKLSDTEVEMFANMRNVAEDVLTHIAEQRRWTGKYSIMANLVKNPKAPLSQAMNMVSRLTNMDLKRIRYNRDVPEPVRKRAEKILTNRIRGGGSSFLPQR
jgi:hypothetical protein